MKRKPFSRHRSGGIALVITLSAVLLLAGLVVAFFSLSSFNRLISFAGTNQTKADFLAHSSVDILVGELRQEIVANSKTGAVYIQNGVTNYPPSAAANLLPSRTGLDGSGTSTNLLKVPASGVPMWTGGPAFSSSIPISQSSLNGRFISASRWFTSATESPNLGSQSTLPTWTYLTRGNGPEVPAIAAAKNRTQPDYVIGRFAYTIYDLSGTLDANVADYAASAPATDVGLKASAAYADVSLLGIPASKLAAWRNPLTGADSSTFLEWAAGIPRTTGTPNQQALAAAASGHLSVVEGDQAVLSRHDLLAMLSEQGLAAAAPYLTHFSRSVNSPSWSPEVNGTTPYTYLTSAESSTLGAVSNPNRDTPNLRYTTSATVTHYSDTGATTQNYGVSSGDAAVQRRFSLAKLAWITYSGVNASALSQASNPAQAVQSCFGLQWDATNERWNYVGSSLPLAPAGAAPQTSIETLAQVAAEKTPREPNFFETLKAAILLGSTGLGSANVTEANFSFQPALDGYTDLQILRIGANIIDTVRSDNYPSTLVLNPQGKGVTPVHGLKDLPYLYAMQCTNFRVVTGSNPYTDHNLAMVLVPELFNPNAASPTPPSAGPKALRVRFLGGSFSSMMSTASPDPFALATASSPTPSTVMISGYNPTTDPFRAGVIPISTATGGDSASAFSTQLPWVTDTDNGFVAYNYPAPVTFTVPASGTTSYSFRATISSSANNLMFVLEYPSPNSNPSASPSGKWLTYDALCGNEAFPSNTGIYVSTAAYIEFDPGSGTIESQTKLSSPLNATSVLSKIDPRTTRFGLGLGNVAYVTTVAPIPAKAPPQGSLVGLIARLPFGSGGISKIPATSPYTGMFSGLWPQGGKSGWTTVKGSATGDANTVANVCDLDQIYRPADGWLGSTSGATTPGSGNLFQTVSNTAHPARPVILGRPFRSVAELGYVFRDNPWKTLSFFDSTSADGALLDFFSVSDEPVVSAGRSNLNTTQTPVLAALLSQTGTVSTGATPLSSSAATALASAIDSYSFSSGAPTATLPQNLSDIPTFMSSGSVAPALLAQIDTIKAHQEAVPRALANTTQTRTWNLLVDVVAQTGQIPATATGLGNFIVGGEKRYWLSIAIDRLTGKIVDQQLEPADE